jgi:hypothetical protein
MHPPLPLPAHALPLAIAQLSRRTLSVDCCAGHCCCSWWLSVVLHPASTLSGRILVMLFLSRWKPHMQRYRLLCVQHVRCSVLHLVCCCCRPVGGAQAHGHQPRQRHTSGTGAAGAHSRSEQFLIHGTRCTWWCWQSTPSLDVYWVHCSDSLCCPRGGVPIVFDNSLWPWSPLLEGSATLVVSLRVYVIPQCPCCSQRTAHRGQLLCRQCFALFWC